MGKETHLGDGLSRTKKMPRSGPRDVSLDALRVIATFSVVLLHVSAKAWAKEPIGTAPWVTATFFDSLVRWCVPAFVMISGSLLMESNRPSRVRGRIFKIALLYLVWSGIYSLIDWSETENWHHALKHFVVGHYHLWYLYMICGIYLILPLLKLLTKKKVYLQYFALLAISFNSIIPQVIGLMSLYSDRWSHILEYALREVGVSAVLGYSGYFVLGYLLHHYGISGRKRRIVYLLGIIGVAATFLGTKCYSEATMKLQGVFFSYFAVNVLAAGIAVFVLFTNWKPPQKWGRYLGIASGYSLGVYLIHPMVLDAMRIAAPYLPETIILRTLLVFAVSAGLTGVLRSIPVIRKSVE